MCFYFDLVSQIHFFLKTIFNWCLKWLKKENNFSYNKGFWNWLGGSHDFQSHGRFLMIFLISSNQTVEGTLLKCDPPVLGSWRCIYMYVDTFVCIYVYIYGSKPFKVQDSNWWPEAVWFDSFIKKFFGHVLKLFYPSWWPIIPWYIFFEDEGLFPFNH